MLFEKDQSHINKSISQTFIIQENLYILVLQLELFSFMLLKVALPRLFPAEALDNH